MNASVTAYAPKNKTYGFTESIDARLAIAAATQIVGYNALWFNIFLVFGLKLYRNLKMALLRSDIRKNKVRYVLKTKEGKAKRSHQRYEKYEKSKSDFLDKMKPGMAYESGIALKNATKQAMNAMTYDERNPEGTDPSIFKWHYHHTKFYTTLGHRDSRSKSCYANGMSAAARSKIVAAIVSETASKTSENKKEHRK